MKEVEGTVTAGDYLQRRANADGKIPSPNSLDPPLSVFTGHIFDETARSQVKTLKGYLKLN